eukprot:13664808-Alexandrium_andersonii.AAC.1
MEQRELLWRTPRAILISGSTQKWPHGPCACTELRPRESLSTYRSAAAQEARGLLRLGCECPHGPSGADPRTSTGPQGLTHVPHGPPGLAAGIHTAPRDTWG